MGSYAKAPTQHELVGPQDTCHMVGVRKGPAECDLLAFHHVHDYQSLQE